MFDSCPADKSTDYVKRNGDGNGEREPPDDRGWPHSSTCVSALNLAKGGYALSTISSTKRRAKEPHADRGTV